jgi:hypothetical protein
MTVREALRAIDVTVEDVFDLGTRRRTKQKEGSRRNVHEKSLREVEQVAGDEEMEALKRWVCSPYRRMNAFHPVKKPGRDEHSSVGTAATVSRLACSRGPID